MIDGDSIEVTFDLGFRLSFRTICRMSHINTPEMKDGGDKAKQWLIGRLGADISRFEVVTHASDKYGRWLIEIFDPTEYGGKESINQTMIQLNLAVPYEGGKR